MLTLVIPTRNRPDFLARLLTYYGAQSLKYRVIIADSSDADSLERTAPTIDIARKRLDLDYQVFGSETDYADKYISALQSVSTPYCALGADDDFFIPSTMDLGIRFLEENDDYGAVHGHAIGFSTTDDGVPGEIARIGRYPQRSFENSSALSRLLSHLMEYTTTWYSLERTDRLVRHHVDTARSGLRNGFHLGEILPSCLTVVNGKLKKLDKLYMVRQSQSENSSKTDQNDLFDWITEPSFNEQYESFRRCLALALKEGEGCREEVAAEIIKQGLWAYLAYYLKRDWQNRYHQPLPPFDWRSQGFRARLHTFRSLNWAISGYRFVRRSVLGRRDEFSLTELLRESSPHHAEFAPVYRAITGDSA